MEGRGGVPDSRIPTRGKQVIALIAGDDLSGGPIPSALRYDGVETRSTSTTDWAKDELSGS